MIEIHLDNTHSVGLGDNLCLISLLASIPETVLLLVTNEHNTYDRLCRLKRIFMISDDNLNIVKSNKNGTYNNTGWPLKLFSDYYRPTQVNVNNSVINLDQKKEKNCIAIAAFHDNVPPGHEDEWPWCKQRPIEYWGRIFNHIKRLDYDVITVDRHTFDLEDKIETLVKNCKAIISYEGGMAHLSHMLGIPCFMVDWKTFSPNVTNLDNLHCEFVHRTNNLYLLRNDEEFFNWDRNVFDRMIYDLKNKKTNNRLINGEFKLSFSRDGCYGNIQVTDRNNNVVLNTSGLFSQMDPFNKLVQNQYFPKAIDNS